MGDLSSITPRWVRALPILWGVAAIALLLPLALGYGGAESIPDVQTSVGGAVRLARLARSSISISGGAALLSLLLSLPVVLVASRLERRRAGITLLSIAALPLFIPPTVLTVAAIRYFGPAGVVTRFLTGGQETFEVMTQLQGAAPALPSAPIYSLPGAALITAWAYHPMMLLAIAAVLRRAGTETERQALLDATPISVLARVTVPAAAGGIFAGAGLIFLFGLAELGVPEALRNLPVLVQEVYVQFAVYFDTRAALGAALLLALIAAVIGLLAGSLVVRMDLSGFAHEENEPPPAARFPPSIPTHLLRVLGWVLGLLPAFCAVAIFVTSANGPMGAGAIWRATWETAHDELVFTLLLGFAFALMAGVAGSLTGWGLASARRPSWGRYALLLPVVLPAPALAMGAIVLMRLKPGSLPLRLDDLLAAAAATHFPLLFIWMLRFGPLTALFVERALRRISPELLGTALIDGAGPLAFWRSIAAPTVWPAVAGGMLGAFALSLGEVGAAVLLLPPGTTTLGVRLLTLMHYAPTGQVSALCLLVMAPGIVTWIVTLTLLGRRFPVLNQQD